MAFIELKDVVKTYKMGEVEIKAVNNISFPIEKGEFVVIVGPSGAGKTTVLNILGGMDTATSGTITVDGVDISQYKEKELTKYRRDDVEQQRVSIARALAKNPKLLLCDEPTGALDYITGKSILKLLQDTCREKGMTVIVITHNTAITPMADKIIQIKNGQVDRILINAEPKPVEQIEW